MKKILILLSLLLGYVNNQAQGVFFEDLTFKQALEKAKRENKYVLLSLSASWCLPCALMKNEVLTQKVVGDYFNTYFVNIHFLTDQSLEGKELAKKFNVKIIPTYIIISPDRTERHRRSAYLDAESLVEWAKRGVGEKTNLHHLEQNVNKLSEWDKSELYYYYLALRDAYRKEESSQIEEMLMTCLTDNDLVKPLYWDLLESKDCRTPQFQFVLKHAKELQMNYNSKRVNSYLAKNFRDTLSKAWEQNDSLKLDALRSVRDMIASVGFPARNYWLSRVNLLYACLEKDKHSFLHNLSIIARDTNTAIGSVDDVWFWALDCVKSFQNERFTSEVLELADCLIDLYCQYRQPYMGIFLKRKITWMLDSPGIQFVSWYTLPYTPSPASHLNL